MGRVLDAFPLAEDVFLVVGAQQEVVLRGEPEHPKFILIILQLYGAFAVGVQWSLGQSGSTCFYALEDIVMLSTGECLDTLGRAFLNPVKPVTYHLLNYNTQF